ncbi:hypothetical protein IAU60_000890 [Kwoniella sp. DSM 27419]
MKASYIAAVMLYASMALAMPTKLNDLTQDQVSIAAEAKTGPGSYNNADGAFAQPLSSPGAGEDHGMAYRSNKPSGRPDEYLSGALRSHDASSDSHRRGPYDPRGVLDSLGPGHARTGTTGAVLPIRQIRRGEMNERASGPLVDGADSLLRPDPRKRPHSVTGVDKLFEEVGSDHLGRKIVKRGNVFHIQEPEDQGRQWGGADELDDINDEPFWG